MLVDVTKHKFWVFVTNGRARDSLESWVKDNLGIWARDSLGIQATSSMES